MITKELIAELKSKANIVELVSEHVDLIKVGDGIYGSICPNPDHHDNDPSFTVFEKENSWCCYGCHYGNKSSGKTHAQTNYGSDAIAFVQWISGGTKSFGQAVRELCQRYSILIPESKNAELYQANRDRADAFQTNLTKKAKQYLYERGLTDDDIKLNQIGFDGKKIVFPLLDIYNRVLGFTRRWIEMPENCRDKYRNSRSDDIFNKSYYLYGIKDIDKTHPYVYITEGPMDKILGTKYKLKNVLATLGTSFTDGHAEIIKNLGLTPVFIMDGDSAGLKSTEKCIEKMATLGVYSMLVLLDNKMDLADAALLYQENLVAEIEQRQITYGYYKISQVITQYQNLLIQAKLKTTPLLQEIVEQVPLLERQAILDFVHETVNITLEKGN